MTHTCSICLSDIVRSDTTEKLRCKHIYHKDCIGKWKEQHNTCPVCRYVIGNVVRATPVLVAVPTPTPRPIPPREPSISFTEYIGNTHVGIEFKKFVNVFNNLSIGKKIVVATCMLIAAPLALCIGVIYGTLSILDSGSTRV